MKDNTIVIKHMKEFSTDISREVAAVFADGYEEYLTFLSKNRERVINAFQKMICPETFYCAAIDEKVVGIVACSNNKYRAINIDKTVLRQSFGYIKGSLTYLFMNEAFNKTLPYEDDTCYIECVATKVDARGKGVSTSLMNYILKETDYKRYILEVTDANEVARHIYKKLGFKEFERIRERFPKLKGFNYRIYMNYSKTENQ